MRIFLVFLLLMCLLGCSVLNSTSKTDTCKGIEIGQVYRMNNSDPFKSEFIFIRILDVKGEYYQYVFTDENGNRLYVQTNSDLCRDITASDMFSLIRK